MSDGWIELFDVETDEAGVLFIFDRCEPVDYGCGVFPLVEVAFFRDRAVDAVEDLARKRNFNFVMKLTAK